MIQHLRLRRQTAKLQLYEKFRVVLAASAVFAVVWAVYGIVQSSEDETVSNVDNTVDPVAPLFSSLGKFAGATASIFTASFSLLTELCRS